jgi:hypothetical protein
MVNWNRTIAFAPLVLGLLLAAPMRGSGSNLSTNNLTFSGPVRLPGVTLAAGTYVFERVEPTNPDVVVVRSGDRRRVYFMASTDRVDRPVELPRNRRVILGEATQGMAPPVLAWYPEGHRMGHAFIYATR